ncbi:carbohydrate sulfotransferase 1-like [Argopecten irradians]|uniref:carbohydrate sulfotransferase 1-like n=1 Tax=Argopecten irradians TaxID=31199 RepID=UPI0037115A36
MLRLRTVKFGLTCVFVVILLIFTVMTTMSDVSSTDYRSINNLDQNWDKPLHIAYPTAAPKIVDIIAEPTEIPTPEPVGPTPILLVTYMRSGSSFVGDLLKINPKTFYSFEPLHKLQAEVIKEKPVYYLDGTLRYPKNFMELSVDAIEHLSTCAMEKLPLYFYQDGFFSGFTDSTKFKICMNKTKIESNLELGRKCSRVLSKGCKNSEFLVAKIIRIPLSPLEFLMKTIPKLKIIHLLRDPRATLSSQFRAGRYKVQNMQSAIGRFCNRVYDDMVIRDTLNRKYPGRIMTIEYEDIVRDPLEYTKRLYEFSGMEFTKHIQTNIVKLTASTQKQSNSSVISSRWRTKLLEGVIKTADEKCQQLYMKYGLKSLSFKDLKNISVPLKVDKVVSFGDFRHEEMEKS